MRVYVIYIYLIATISADPTSVLLLLITRKVHLKGIHPLAAQVNPSAVYAAAVYSITDLYTPQSLNDPIRYPCGCAA